MMGKKETTLYKEAILDNFLSDRPDGWDYDKIIKKLNSLDFYDSREDKDCPSKQCLGIYQPYEDWSTVFLAEIIEDVARCVEASVATQRGVYESNIADLEDAILSLIDNPYDEHVKQSALSLIEGKDDE